MLEAAGPHTLEAIKYVIGRTADPGLLPDNDDCRFDAEWIAKPVHAAMRKDAATKGRRKRVSKE